MVNPVRVPGCELPETLRINLSPTADNSTSGSQAFLDRGLTERQQSGDSTEEAWRCGPREQSVQYRPLDTVPGQGRTDMTRDQCEARCDALRPACRHYSSWIDGNGRTGGCHVMGASSSPQSGPSNVQSGTCGVANVTTALNPGLEFPSWGGRNYGWDRDLTANARRTRPAGIDRYAQFAGLQPREVAPELTTVIDFGDSNATWKVAVPPGVYDVNITYYDAQVPGRPLASLYCDL